MCATQFFSLNSITISKTIKSDKNCMTQFFIIFFLLKKNLAFVFPYIPYTLYNMPNIVALTRAVCIYYEYRR